MAIPTSPLSKPGSLFFDDALSCKAWLKTIPLTNIAQAQQTILDALRMVNCSNEFAALERLTCMELLRAKTAFLLDEQRGKYATKTIPLSVAEYAAWNVSQNLIAEMEAGYRRCWADTSADNEELKAHAALIIQRIIRYIGLQMLMAGFIYRRFDRAIWMRLHLQWIEAEERGLTQVRIKDSVGSLEGYSSVAQAYTAVLMGQLANVYELTPRQINFVDAVLKRFGHKISVLREPPTIPQGAACVVDLLADAGAYFQDHFQADVHIRLLEVEELSRSLRRRLKKLNAGEEPANLDLPADWNITDTLENLQRLHQVWCEGNTARPMANVPDERDAILSFGISETHFILSGDLFEQPGVKRELTRAEMNDIAMFGKISESTIRAKYADFNYGTETWGIIDESRGAFRVMRLANSPRGVAIGKLVGIKVGKTGIFYLAVVREIVEEIEGQITVTIAMLPGKPEPVSVRSGELQTRAGASYVQGFRLPPIDALRIRETLIIPSNLTQKGRGIDIYHHGHGSPKQVTLVDYIERGVDFDRIIIA